MWMYNVEVDVDIDRYFGCLKGDFIVSLGVVGIGAVMVLTSIILKERAVFNYHIFILWMIL